MEQKTEASQAVDDQAVSVEVYSNAVWLTNGMQVFRLAYTGESDVDRNWYAGQLRAALKAEPAPTEAQDDGLSPVYAWLERSTRNSPAEVSNASRTMMAFYQGAEFPDAAQGDYMVRMDAPDAMRIVKANWPDMGRIERAFFANVPPIPAAQGEDSARLDALEKLRDIAGRLGEVGRWETAGSIHEAVDVLADIDHARASAETGGVKS